MFARKWGLTCDHLIRIKVVDGTGGCTTQRRNPICSGVRAAVAMGHFGILTELTFNTRVAPSQSSSWKFRPYKLDPVRAAALLEAWFEAASDLPNEAFQPGS